MENWWLLLFLVIKYKVFVVVGCKVVLMVGNVGLVIGVGGKFLIW